MYGIKGRSNIHDHKAAFISESEEDSEEQVTREEESDNEINETLRTTTTTEQILPPYIKEGFSTKNHNTSLYAKNLKSTGLKNAVPLVPKSTNSKFRSVVLQVLCILIFACACKIFINSWLVKSTEQGCYKNLKENYPQIHMILRSLEVCVNNTLNKTNKKSNVYLIVHYNDDRHDSTSKLMEAIQWETSKCLDSLMEPVHMNTERFKSKEAKKDYGLIIEEFKEKIKQSKVIVVDNLNEIPFETAPALHTICDTESPIDKDVIVFLTLKINEKIDEKGNGLENSIEKILNKMWSNLTRNELDPLITRITDNVFSLRAE